jgi:hypothetical protein
MFWVFFMFWFGIFATIALIIIINYRVFNRTNPELRHEIIGRHEFDERARRDKGRKRRDWDLAWSLILWAAFLAAVCGATFSQQAAIFDWMHEAWKTFLNLISDIAPLITTPGRGAAALAIFILPASPLPRLRLHSLRTTFAIAPLTF